jgi:hypothetical protein
VTYIIRDRGKDEDVYVPTPEEAAEIDAGFEEIARGEWVDGDEFLRDLRQRLERE